MTAFNVGDLVVLDGQITKITSWPSTDEGFFAWERYDKKTDSLTYGSSWYGEDADGNQLHNSAQLEMYQPATGQVETTLAPIPAEVLNAVAAQAPAPAESPAE